MNTKQLCPICKGSSYSDEENNIDCDECGGTGYVWVAISKPTLAANTEEAQRMTYAGRSMPALREAKTFDHTRLQASPLFKPTIRTLFGGE